MENQLLIIVVIIVAVFVIQSMSNSAQPLFKEGYKNCSFWEKLFRQRGCSQNYIYYLELWKNKLHFEQSNTNYSYYFFAIF